MSVIECVQHYFEFTKKQAKAYIQTTDKSTINAIKNYYTMQATKNFYED